MIGYDTNKYSFYIVRAENEPPQSQAYFTEYTANFTTWDIKGGVSSLATFNGVAVSIDTDAAKTDFTAGNYLYVLCKRKIIFKFLINKPNYRSDYKVEITGIQSSGTHDYDVNDSYRRRNLSTETTSKIKYVQEYAEDIIYNGVLSDENGVQILWAQFGADDSSFWDKKISMSLDYENRVSALSKGCKIAKAEYIIKHGSNSTTPYHNGDSAYIFDRIGSSTSTYTFYLSGTNQNAKISEGAEDTEGSYNDVIIKGTDQTGAQVESRLFHASLNKTYSGVTIDNGSGADMLGGPDGWLYEDLDNADRVWRCYTLHANPFSVGEKIICNQINPDGSRTSVGEYKLASYYESSGRTYLRVWPTNTPTVLNPTGTGYEVIGTLSGETDHLDTSQAGRIKVYIGPDWYVKRSIWGTNGKILVRIDNELIECSRTIPWYSSDRMELNILRKGATDSLGNPAYGRGAGTPATKIASHKKGSDVTLITDSIAADNSFRLYVSSTSGFPSTGTIRVGSEELRYFSKGANYFDCYRDFGTSKNPDVDSGIWYGSYAHSGGILVCDGGTATGVDNKATYRPYNPQTGSRIQLTGLNTTVLTENQTSNRNELDKKAQTVLESKGDDLNKIIEIDVVDPATVWNTINIGDTITISNVGSVDIDTGDYRIMGVTWSFTGTQAHSLKLHIKDNNTRAYFSDDFIDSLDEAEQPNRQASTRGQDTNQFTFGDQSGTDDTEKNYNYSAVKLKGLVDPEEAQDAVTKSYADSLFSSSGGGSIFNLRFVEPVSGSYAVPTRADPPVINFAAGSGITITPSGNTVTFTAGGAGSGYWEVSGGQLQPVTGTPAVVGPRDNLLTSLGSATYAWNETYTQTIRGYHPSLGLQIYDKTDYVASLTKAGANQQIRFNSTNMIYANTAIPEIVIYVNGNDKLAIDGSTTWSSNTFMQHYGTTWYASFSTSISFEAGTISFDAYSTDFNLNAGDDVNISSGDNITIEADDDAEFNAYDDITIESTGSNTGRISLITNGGTGSSYVESVSIRAYSDCYDDLGAGSPWDNIYCDNLYENECDIAELQWIDSNVQVGDVVELGDWDNTEEFQFYSEQLEKCLEKQSKGFPCMQTIGLRGKWFKAKPNTTRCPSVVSAIPGTVLNAREDRINKRDLGKMAAIGLSGSIPFVFITGKFISGDILVSAGDGKAKVNNDAPWNQVVGYAKQSGENERCEVWVR